MSGVEQLLSQDPLALVEIIRRQQDELGQRDSALALCDIRIEQVQREAAAAIAQRESAIELIKREAADQMEAMRQKHQAEIAALLRRFYGSRNERFDPAQLLLFGKLIDTMPLNVPAIEQESGEQFKTRRPRDKHGRQRYPEHLERIPVKHDLTDDQKPCPCCGKVRRCIGVELSEQMEYFPAWLKVLLHQQCKYACDNCELQGLDPQIELAPKTAQPIAKGMAGPGLLAYVITSKFADHLPLYRLVQIFARHGAHIADSTMCGWIMSAAELLAPLTLLMARRVKQSKCIRTDETAVRVQDSEGRAPKGECLKGHMWAYLGDDKNPYVVFAYSPDRTNTWPVAWLEGYCGYLQADAYSGYDAIFRLGTVTEAGCWAHGRRKFFDAKETDSLRAAQMLRMVQGLYAVEGEAKEQIALLANATSEQADEIRRELRQRKSVLILAEIKAWLDREIQLVLPRSPMAAAMNYVLNQWAALNVYTMFGFLSIDNNAAERAMKLIALGRKNWLFAGNGTFAEHYATLYSLIASAQRHGVDPHAYLTSVLTDIVTTPPEELDQLLPDVWKARVEARARSQQPAGP